MAISPRDGTGWALGGDQVLYHRLRDGTNKPVLNIADYQMKDPDPVDIDQDPPDPFESNPYGLAVTLSGDALVADAAGNDLIRVTPGGKPTTMARWDNEVDLDRRRAWRVPGAGDPVRSGADIRGHRARRRLLRR